MKRLKGLFSGGPLEAAVAIVSFGGSSLYWLALAYIKSPADYGHMMTVQSAVLIVVMIFTFRTQDLFFNLISQHGCPVEVAYRRTLRVELAAGAAGTTICTIGALLLDPTARGAAAALGVGIFGLLASLAVIQGSTLGSLRYLTRGNIIAKTDMLAAASWAAACVSIPFIHDQPAIVPLIIGAAPPATRTLALFASVRRILPGAAAPSGDELSETPVIGSRTVIRFLGGAQITNFLKNANVSIETVFLAAFVSPALVGLYRVARAAQGASTAALNVAYQRHTAVMAKASSDADRAVTARRLGRRSLFICLMLYPASALAGLAYSLLKPEVGILQLQLMTAGTFLALVPTAVQQGSTAMLLLKGRHRALGTAYTLSLATLGLTALIMFITPRIEIFIAGVICAGFVRQWYLGRNAYAVNFD